MLADLKRLGKETAVYGLSTVVGRLLNFLLLPFYTHVLRPEDLGIVAIVLAYVAFLNVVFQHGMDQAYLRFSAGAGTEGRRRTFSTASWSLTASSLVLAALVAVLGPALAPWLGFGRRPELAFYAAGILALDALAAVPFAELRLSHHAWHYAGIKLSNIAVNVALNVVLIRGLGLGLDGIFLAYLAASGATLALLAPVLAGLWRGPGAFRRELWLDLLRFGLPFVPAGLASMTVQLIDRPLLLRFTDEGAVGVYQANHKLGIFMMLVVAMFDAAWRPFFLEHADKPGARELFGRVLTYFLLAGSWVVLALSLFIGELVRVPVLGRPIIHPDYWPGLVVVPVVLSGYLFNGAYVNFIAQPTLAKRTGLLVYATAAGAAVNIAANLALIPPWGMLGAAWASLLAYAAMAACLYAMGRRLYPIPYEWGRVAHMAYALCAVCLGLHALRPVLSGGFNWALARGAAVTAYPALLWATGFLDKRERRALRL